MIKIDFCSDLHVDAWQGHTQLHDPTHRRWMGEPFKSTYIYLDWARYRSPDSDVLVIAGDTANNVVISRDVIEAAASAYKFVVVVDGNHDHYMNDMSVEEGQELLARLISHLPNVYLLKHDQSLLLDGVLFAGATGWYDFKAYEDKGITDYLAKRVWKQYSNDSVYPKFDAGSPESLAMIQTVNLAEQVRKGSEDPDIESIVVVTHMSPRADLMEWKADQPVWNALTPSYVNTGLKSVLDADVNKKIRYWIYGHTHSRQMVSKDGVVYVNNARGYPNENPPFTLTQIEVACK